MTVLLTFVSFVILYKKIFSFRKITFAFLLHLLILLPLFNSTDANVEDWIPLCLPHFASGKFFPIVHILATINYLFFVYVFFEYLTTGSDLLQFALYDNLFN